MLPIIGLLASAALYTPVLDTVHLPLPLTAGRQVALHCAEPQHPTDRAVLFIHGASFPTMLAFGFEFKPGDSWLMFMAREGFLACGLDFLGYGDSSHPPELDQDPASHPPLVRAPEAAQEIAAAVAYLKGPCKIAYVHLVAHSWGTIPAAEYAAEHPGSLTSLTLFGPVVPVQGEKQEPVDYAWFKLTAEERYQELRFLDVLPKDTVLLDPTVDRSWAKQFADTAPGRWQTGGGGLHIPAGAIADFTAAKEGRYPYDAAVVTVPIFAVYGDYDDVVNDQTAIPFLSRFTASPLKWRLRIDHGTHVMHLEKNRRSLYEAVYGFIRLTQGQAESPHGAAR